MKLQLTVARRFEPTTSAINQFATADCGRNSYHELSSSYSLLASSFPSTVALVHSISNSNIDHFCLAFVTKLPGKTSKLRLLGSGTYTTKHAAIILPPTPSQPNEALTMQQHWYQSSWTADQCHYLEVSLGSNAIIPPVSPSCPSRKPRQSAATFQSRSYCPLNSSVITNGQGEDMQGPSEWGYSRAGVKPLQFSLLHPQIMCYASMHGSSQWSYAEPVMLLPVISTCSGTTSVQALPHFLWQH